MLLFEVQCVLLSNNYPFSAVVGAGEPAPLRDDRGACGSCYLKRVTSLSYPFTFVATQHAQVEQGAGNPCP